MSNVITLAALRISEANPNHHLWNNNGTWFLHYTVYPTPFTSGQTEHCARACRSGRSGLINQALHLNSA
ncbi:MAG: hypothetical protein EBT89_03320 [Opitutaceae bacterium]|nr:hypothetical protein [Opitutaceae bacterium]